jgi:hypothetical protein
MPLNDLIAPLAVTTALGLTAGTASADAAATWSVLGRGDRLRLTALAFANEAPAL